MNQRGHLFRILIAAAGSPNGLTNEQAVAMTGQPSNAIGARFNDWAKAGHLHKAKVKGFFLRVFADEGHRDAWIATAKPVAKLHPLTEPLVPRGRCIAPPKLKKLKKVTIVDGDMIIPPTAKITRATPVTHDPRFQCDPAAKVFGAGFAAAGIGRDIHTGRAWQPNEGGRG